MTPDAQPRHPSDRTRAAYLDGARSAVRLLASPEVARRWRAPSVLGGMSVGDLAGHLARSILQVEWFLDAPVNEHTRVDAVTYYARLLGTTDPDSDLNVGVRRRSAETASEGADAVSSQVEEVLARLETRLLGEPANRDVEVAHRPGEVMTLDDYLRTRCVELAVHIDDLAHSSDDPTLAPSTTVSLAVDLLVSAARERHGDRAVLLALTRQERDLVHAVRVL